MFEYDVKFIFDGFLIITSVYAPDDDVAENTGIDKLAENGLDVRDFGRYQMELEIMAEIL